MANLQADLSNEFLKSFMPETIYLVEDDLSLPAPALPDSEAATAQHHVVAKKVDTEVKFTSKVAPTALPKIPQIEAAPVQQQKYRIIGQNHKGIAVLVTLPDADFMQLPQLGFLQKILGAIGLKADDVAYVNNISGELAQFKDLQQALEVKYIISFASRVKTDLPHDKFTLYNPVTVGDVPIVFSHALAMLENNVEYKKQLWGALQRVFL
ncbi:hypothetical protein [Pontibacter oryzae]|uniref:Uncharacterized protein n=1 Tax=Pontibacter oryzae TaxID=2304593 RepID=A0A399SCD8_9BACT|nr:hypothetical protein [Pontibacter oryzae]RIJ41736.1 hypothetical protein D1627_06855 [Pontibacter oryzae]